MGRVDPPGDSNKMCSSDVSKTGYSKPSGSRLNPQGAVQFALFSGLISQRGNDGTTTAFDRGAMGAAGVDEESIRDFERKLKDNLYRLWNRMSSGSYLPPPVRTVSIPKPGGGERKLGIPTVMDRVAQMVVKMQLEPKIEPLFHEDSFGYRPLRSAHDALGKVRRRCWENDWVIDLDIKGFFDNIPHDLLLRAVRKHSRDRWVILHIERWLTAPAEDGEGCQTKRGENGSAIYYCLSGYSFDLLPQSPVRGEAPSVFGGKAAGSRTSPHVQLLADPIQFHGGFLLNHGRKDPLCANLLCGLAAALPDPSRNVPAPPE